MAKNSSFDRMLPIQTILIADDDPDLRTILSDRFRAEGWAVLTADNGVEALHLIETEAPPMVILDLQLPYMNGLEVLRTLRLRGDLRVVVLISAGPSEPFRHMAFQAGADAYMVKPFSNDELRRTVAGVAPRLSTDSSQASRHRPHS